MGWMESLYAWIRNIVIYMILNTIIMNLLGNSSYKKYISIVSGMILVIIVVSPFMKLLNMQENLDYYLNSNDFAIETSGFKNELLYMEEKQSDIVFDEYKERIRSQVETILTGEGLSLTAFNLTFDRDIKSISFGEILQMDIKAKYQEEGVNSEKIIRIEEIEISDIGSVVPKEKKPRLNPPSPAEINIKIKLSDFYNIEPDNINISIQGG